MRNRYLYVTTLLSLLGFSAEAMAQALTQTPRLVVSIAVEQLRTDYLENYAPLYSTEGLRKMLAEGIVFPNASYNFTPVDRTSAIASLVTGSIPYYNNITGTEWLDRNTLRPCHTLSDNDYGYSPQQLGTSTLADELKIATNGTAKVFAFATSAECAILSAGHTADGAAWLEQQAWETARYYTPANPWLDRYVRLYPPLSTSNDINGNITRIALKCLVVLDIFIVV